MKIIKETQQGQIDKVFDSLMCGDIKEAQEFASKYAKAFGKFPGLSAVQRARVVVEAWNKDREEIFCHFVSEKYPLRFIYHGKSGPINLLKQVVHVIGTYESDLASAHTKCKMLKYVINLAGKQKLFIDSLVGFDYLSILDVPMELGGDRLMTLLEFAFKNKADNLAFDLLSAGANPFVTLSSSALMDSAKMYEKNAESECTAVIDWLKETSKKLHSYEKKVIENWGKNTGATNNGASSLTGSLRDGSASYFSNVQQTFDVYLSLMHKPVVVGVGKFEDKNKSAQNAICTKNIEITAVAPSVLNNLPNVPIAIAAFRGESFIKKVMQAARREAKQELGLLIATSFGLRSSTKKFDLKSIGWINPGSRLFWDYMALFSVQRQSDVVSNFKLLNPMESIDKATEPGKIMVANGYCKRIFSNPKTSLIKWNFNNQKFYGEMVGSLERDTSGSIVMVDEVSEVNYLNGLWKQVFKYNEPGYIAHPYLVNFCTSLITAKDKDCYFLESLGKDSLFKKYTNKFKLSKVLTPLMAIKYNDLVDFLLKKSIDFGALTSEPQNYIELLDVSKNAIKNSSDNKNLDAVVKDDCISDTLVKCYYDESLVAKRTEIVLDDSTVIVPGAKKNKISNSKENDIKLLNQEIGLEKWINDCLSRQNIESFLNLNKQSPGKMVFLLMELFQGQLHKINDSVLEQAVEKFGHQAVSNFVNEISTKVVNKIYTNSLDVMAKNGKNVFSLIFDNVNLNMNESALLNFKQSVKRKDIENKSLNVNQSINTNNGLICEYQNDATFLELMCAKYIYEECSVSESLKIIPGSIYKDVIIDVLSKVQNAIVSNEKVNNSKEMEEKRANNENSFGNSSVEKINSANDLKSDLIGYIKERSAIDVVLDVNDGQVWRRGQVCIKKLVHPLFWNIQLNCNLLDLMFNYSPAIMSDKANNYFALDSIIWESQLNTENTGGMSFVSKHLQCISKYLDKTIDLIGKSAVSENVSENQTNSFTFKPINLPVSWCKMVKNYSEPGVLPDFGQVKDLATKISTQAEWLSINKNIKSQFLKESVNQVEEESVVQQSSSRAKSIKSL